MRLLLLIDGACEPVSDAERTDPGLEPAVGVVRTQVRLQKLDFWLRNPDYLADELLSKYQASREARLLELAGDILDSEEPEVRHYPMLRHHFGAYEPLDDALAVLRSAGLLARRRRGTVSRVRQHDYFLLAPGRAAAREVIRQEPVFQYYVDRVALVLDLADGRGGSQLKQQQYLQREYAEAAAATVSVRCACEHEHGSRSCAGRQWTGKRGTMADEAALETRITNRARVNVDDVRSVFESQGIPLGTPPARPRPLRIHRLRVAGQRTGALAPGPFDTTFRFGEGLTALVASNLRGKTPSAL